MAKVLRSQTLTERSSRQKLWRCASGRHVNSLFEGQGCYISVSYNLIRRVVDIFQGPHIMSLSDVRHVMSYTVSVIVS